MSTSFVEETSHTRIDLHCRQNDLKVQIQQLINNYGKDSVERRHRDGFYSGKLTQFNNFWQQFCVPSMQAQRPINVSVLTNTGISVGASAKFSSAARLCCLVFF